MSNVLINSRYGNVDLAIIRVTAGSVAENMARRSAITPASSLGLKVGRGDCNGSKGKDHGRDSGEKLHVGGCSGFGG